MKNRKIVIPLFIILIISFVAMLFFYFYKKHNDKIKLQEEQKLNEKLIKEKIDLINKNYGIFVDGEKIQSDDEIATFFNNIIDIKSEINSLKVNGVTITNITNPKKSIEKNNDLYNKINDLKYPKFNSFTNLSKEENKELERIYNESEIIKNIKNDEDIKEKLLNTIKDNNEFLTFLDNNKNKYYVNGFDIIYKDENFANDFRKYNTKYNLLNENNLGKKVPVLMYHAVSDNPWGDTTLFVSIKNFELQMKYLYDNGYTPLFLSEIDSAKNYDKPIVVTFDDGYKNIYDYAYPILKKYNVKSSFYLITDWMDGDTYISPEMVVELDKSKLFEIGVHTKTHVKLGTLDYDTQYNEIIESKNALEKLLNKKITTIAYPYGSYNTDTINITKSAFDYAVTVESGFNYSNKLDRLRLKRFKIPRSMDINTFINVIEGK